MTDIPNKSDLATKEDLFASTLAIKEDIAQLGRDLHRAFLVQRVVIVAVIAILMLLT